MSKNKEVPPPAERFVLVTYYLPPKKKRPLVHTYGSPDWDRKRAIAERLKMIRQAKNQYPEDEPYLSIHVCKIIDIVAIKAKNAKN